MELNFFFSRVYLLAQKTELRKLSNFKTRLILYSSIYNQYYLSQRILGSFDPGFGVLQFRNTWIEKWSGIAYTYICT